MSSRDEILRFHVRLNRLAAGLSRDIADDVSALLLEIERDVINRSRRAGLDVFDVSLLRRRIRELRADLAQRMVTRTNETLETVVELSPVALSRAVEEEGEDGSSYLAMGAALAGLLASEHDGRTWGDWAIRKADDAARRARTRLDRFVSNPQTDALATFRAEMRAAERVLRADVGALASTSILNTANQARARMLVRRPGPFRRWVYSAVLDNKTSAVCRGLSGSVWRFDDPTAPFPPRHPNCRSVVLPVTSLSEALDEPTYDEFLARQGDAVAREVLGPTRFRAWKNGVALQDMATADIPLTVAQIKRAYAKETVAA